MSTLLRMLLLEDRADDAELIVAESRRAGFQLDWHRVDTAADYAAALSEPLDLILADYSLPQYNALKALQVLHEHQLNIPFIVITGSTREEIAVECMQHGAADYLIKDRLARLGQSVQRALEQKRLRDDSDRAGQALRESEQRYRAIFDGVRDAIFVEALNGQILDVNASACEMYGDTRENLLRKTVFDLVPGGEPVFMPDGTGEISLPGGTIETINLRANGERFPVEISGRMTAIHGEQVILVTVRDIAERKLAEAALQDSERRMREIVDNAPFGAHFYDLGPAGQLIFVGANRAADSILNVSNRQFIGKTIEEAFPPLGQTDIPDAYRRVAALGEQYDTDQVEYAEGGIRGAFEVHAFQTSPHRMAAFFNDISERKQREFELQSIAEVSAALRVAPTHGEMFPVIINIVSRLFKADGATLAMYHDATGELVTVIARGQLDSMADLRMVLGQGIIGQVAATRQPYVTENIQADARLVYPERWGNLRAAICMPLIAEDQIIGAIWIGREQPAFTREELRLLTSVADIAANALERANIVATLERRVAERTRELEGMNERLTELDQLKSKFVSDVSHELRTPLTSLVLYLSLLEHGKPEKRDHYMTALKEQAARLTTLIEDILDLSRLERITTASGFERVDLNMLAEHVMMAHQPRADAAGLRLIFEPQPDLPAMQGEPRQLTQVITNLVANAVSYTPAGQVLIRTFHEDGLVCVQIADTGLGIEPQDIPHLFERFYRGKRTAQANLPGSGLGLAIVKEIVQAHGGTLDLHSAVGEGSTFTVKFPI